MPALGDDRLRRLPAGLRLDDALRWLNRVARRTLEES